ncbi:hypothetical protein HZC30_03320 [Candidatus Woesearchaeota archaeon]|nr:hypothetical protein [Candidatus Woesearchaeota archaeon]
MKKTLDQLMEGSDLLKSVVNRETTYVMEVDKFRDVYYPNIIGTLSRLFKNPLSPEREDHLCEIVTNLNELSLTFGMIGNILPYKPLLGSNLKIEQTGPFLFHPTIQSRADWGIVGVGILGICALLSEGRTYSQTIALVGGGLLLGALVYSRPGPFAYKLLRSWAEVTDRELNSHLARSP